MVVLRSSGEKSSPKRGRLSVPAAFVPPHAALGNERHEHEDQRAGDEAGQQRVAPRGAPAPAATRPLRGASRMNATISLNTSVTKMPPSDANASVQPMASSRCRLSVEQLREPRHRRDEFDAHADERRAAEEHELPEFGAVRGRERRDRVDENAADHHGLAAEAVDHHTAEQARTRRRRAPRSRASARTRAARGRPSATRAAIPRAPVRRSPETSRVRRCRTGSRWRRR